MFVFERRLSFGMLYFVKNDNKIILQGRWGSISTVGFAVGLWQNPSGGSEGKVSGLFTCGG